MLCQRLDGPYWKLQNVPEVFAATASEILLIPFFKNSVPNCVF